MSKLLYTSPLPVISGMIALLGLATSLSAQLSFTSAGTTIDFDSTITGVSNGAYDGSGRVASPSVGQLDSQFWAGFAQGFDSANPGGSFANGVYDNVSDQTGFQAAEITSGDRSFAFRASNDNAPAFDFRFINDGVTLNNITISFDAAYFKLNATRLNGLNVSYAVDTSGDAITDTEVNALSFTPLGELTMAPEAATAVDTWHSYGSLSSSFLATVNTGDAIILRFEQSNLGGAGGSRTMNAIDNLTIVPEPSFYAAALGLLALGFVAYRRRPR